MFLNLPFQLLNTTDFAYNNYLLNRTIKDIFTNTVSQKRSIKQKLERILSHNSNIISKLSSVNNHEFSNFMKMHFAIVFKLYFNSQSYVKDKELVEKTETTAPVHRRQDGHGGRRAALGRRGHRRGGADRHGRARRGRRHRGPAAWRRGCWSASVRQVHRASSIRMRSAALRVVFDAANGMAGVYLPPVLERLATVAEPVRCSSSPTGRFPNHEPNPLLEENRRDIIAAVRKRGRRPRHRLGRRRRPLLLHRRHRRVHPRRLRDRAARARCCWREPPAPPSSTTCAPRARCRTRVRAAGGIRLMHRVGHAFIKVTMRERTRSSAARSRPTTTSATTGSPTTA